MNQPTINHTQAQRFWFLKCFPQSVPFALTATEAGISLPIPKWEREAWRPSATAASCTENPLGSLPGNHTLTGEDPAAFYL